MLLSFLTKATEGCLEVSSTKIMILPALIPYHYYSEMNHRDRWFSELHLQLSGEYRSAPPIADLIKADNALRLAQPPFDGLNDAATWLGLPVPGSTQNATVTMRVAPPVDLMTDKCILDNDHLHLILHAHPNFDVTCVRLSLRAVPGTGIRARR